MSYSNTRFRKGAALSQRASLLQSSMLAGKGGVSNEGKGNQHLGFPKTQHGKLYLKRLWQGEDDGGTVHLTTTNAMAESINSKKLAQLPGTQYNYRGIAEGKFKLDSLPADEVLSLKKGTQVMFLVNDNARRWVNGTIGIVTGLSDQSVRVKVGGIEFNVGPHDWSLYNYKFDEEKGEILQELVGLFTQFLLRLAWAITIHKS